MDTTSPVMTVTTIINNNSEEDRTDGGTKEDHQ